MDFDFVVISLKIKCPKCKNELKLNYNIPPRKGYESYRCTSKSCNKYFYIDYFNLDGSSNKYIEYKIYNCTII